VVVTNPAPAAIPNVILTEQILFVDIPFRAICGRPLSGAPQLGQHETVVAIDHGHIGIEEILLRDMALIDVGDLEAIQALERAGSLGRAEVTAIAEGGRDIPLLGRNEPSLKAGKWAKSRGPVQPVFRVRQHVDDIAFRQTFCEQAVNLRKACGFGPLLYPAQDGFSIFNR